MNPTINEKKLNFDAINKEYIEYMISQQHQQMTQSVDPYYALLSAGSPMITGCPMVTGVTEVTGINTRSDPTYTNQKLIQQDGTTNNNMTCTTLKQQAEGNPSEIYKNVIPTTVIESSGSIKQKQFELDYEKKILERKQLDLDMSKKEYSSFNQPNTFMFPSYDQTAMFPSYEQPTMYASYEQSIMFPSHEQPKIVMRNELINLNKDAENHVELINKTKEKEWNELTIDDINTSLKVITELQPGYKLKIINKSYLAPDNSYTYLCRSYWNGADRNTIINFLEYLFDQISLQINKLITNIKTDSKNNYKKIGTLNDMIHNLSTFIHNYNKIKYVYKSDTSCCSRLDNIYKKYINLHTIIMCEMTNK